MTVTAVEKDPDGLTMTITSEFEATPERVWALWSDPRLLERWWGPPSHPATVVEHDLAPGGTVTYFMTGPDGERYPGWWKVLTVEPPRLLELRDGFSDEDGNPDPDMPTSITRVEVERAGSRTRMVLLTRFPSREAMEQTLEMGAEEGMKLAMGQIDALLAD